MIILLKRSADDSHHLSHFAFVNAILFSGVSERFNPASRSVSQAIKSSHYALIITISLPLLYPPSDHELTQKKTKVTQHVWRRVSTTPPQNYTRRNLSDTTCNEKDRSSSSSLLQSVLSLPDYDIPAKARLLNSVDQI